MKTIENEQNIYILADYYLKPLPCAFQVSFSSSE